MPSFKRDLMMGVGLGLPPMTDIPTVAAWQGLVVRAMRHMTNEKRRIASGASSYRSHELAFRGNMMRSLGVRSTGPGDRGDGSFVDESRDATSRVAGDLTSSQLVSEALTRYHAGILSAGSPRNALSKSIHGLLLTDIYAITGKCMNVITRNSSLRTDYDCAIFPLYRALHWATADAFGKVFNIEADQIDNYLRRQNIMMTEHGAGVDRYVGSRKFRHGGVSRLVYLSDEEALAVRLEIEGGKFLIRDGHGDLVPFDCSGPEYKDTSKEFVMDRGGRFKRQPTRTNNPARRGDETNADKGVAGFAMGTNREIYAMKHSNYNIAQGSIYHSSYLNGREVLSTGCITVVDGTLEYINNWSGHYKPSMQQILLVLRAFQTFGVDLTRVRVECQTSGGTFDMLAPEFMRLSEQQDQFGGGHIGRFNETAEKIRQALRDYEKKTGKWWSKPSQASINGMNQLKAIRDPESLVKTTYALLRRNRLGKSLHGRLVKVMEDSTWKR
ncbi:MAG: hypothetical protein ABGW78_06225 [Pirellulales bacterium]